ncbi:hypothetical protein DXG01_016940 [Tephrocybe rancida]|nr:hypothetical protein DXG01_016940 [Tephrocybe rancida]
MEKYPPWPTPREANPNLHKFSQGRVPMTPHPTREGSHNYAVPQDPFMQPQQGAQGFAPPTKTKTLHTSWLPLSPMYHNPGNAGGPPPNGYGGGGPLWQQAHKRRNQGLRMKEPQGRPTMVKGVTTRTTGGDGRPWEGGGRSPMLFPEPKWKQYQVQTRPPEARTICVLQPKEVEDYVTECVMTFFAKPLTYTQPYLRVAFVASYSKEAALNHYTAHLTYNPNHAMFTDWEAFLCEFSTKFGIPNTRVEAENTLTHLTMKDWERFSMFIIHYEQEAFETSWNERSLRFHLAWKRPYPSGYGI